MDAGTRLIKTAKGREEIELRRHKLASKLRTLLILVDGTRSINEITNDATRLGAPDNAVLLLMRDGFVEPVMDNDIVAGDPGRRAAQDGAEAPMDEFARFRAAKQFMNETAVDNLGALKKFTFTLKLERCSVRQDLADLVDDYGQSLTKAIGRDAAAVLVARLRVLLG